MPHSEEISARLLRPEQWFGGLIAVLVCSANVDQPLTNVTAALNFDTNNVGPFGRISRVGQNINIGVDGFYAFSLQPQVTQNTANNLTVFWAQKNGVDVPSSMFRFSSTGSNDTVVQTWSVTASLLRGDVIRFMALTGSPNGSFLDATAAVVGAPATPALRLDIRGYGPRA